jgi:FkbM family methyltransferase
LNLHHSIAKSFGYELRSIRKHHPTLEAHLKILFKCLKVDAVLDIGANMGQYGIMLRKMGYRGAIYSFEPGQSSFQELSKASASDVDWQILNYALGSETAGMDFNITAASEFSSLLQPNAYGKNVYADKIPVKSTETISVKRLDDVLPELISNKKYTRLFLKMDTQGYDLKVLAGATKVLDSVVALQSEISVCTSPD